jgi:peptidoglycan hydrolase-like protein with peptidoglycan-binding domain
MLTSWTKLLAVLTLCSTTTLGACAMGDANSGDDTTGRDGSANSDAVTDNGATNSSKDEQISIVKPDSGIIINLSVTQWQTDLRAWQIAHATCRPSVTIDGNFGPMTTTATECFQRLCGLSQDGVVGKMTFDRMCASLWDMARGDLIRASQCDPGDFERMLPCP